MTYEVTNIANEGAQFNGSIESIGGNVGVENYGFVWSMHSLPTIEDSRSNIDGNMEIGAYSKQISNDLILDEVYYVRAFVETDQQVIYGNVVSFVSLGSLPPQISHFFPKESLDGVPFKIYGSNFSGTPNGNTVKIGDEVIEVLSASDSVLEVRSPNTPLFGEYNISVEVAKKVAVSTEKFTVLGPRILSVPKNSGRVGEVMIATGEYFLTANLWQIYGEITTIISDNQFEFYVTPHQNDVPMTNQFSLISYRPGSDPNNGKVAIYPEDFTIINSWNKLPSEQIEAMPGYSSQIIGNKIYCMGGNSLVVYNTTLRSWTTSADFPGAYRLNGSSFVLNNKIYYGFGSTEYYGTYYNDLWEYDPFLDLWTLIGNTPLSPRSKPEILVIENKVYIGFGFAVTDHPDYPIDLWEFDMENKSWNELNVPLSGLSVRTSFVIDDKGYFINSINGNLWQFDPALNTWVQKANYPRSPGYEPAMTSSTSAFVVSEDSGWGSNSEKETHIEEYDAQKDYWRPRQILVRENYTGLHRFSHFVNGKIIYATNDIWELTFE